MNTRSTVFLSIVLLAFAYPVVGQSPVRSYDTAANTSYARFALRYKSDYYYMGRADSAKAPYLVPSIGYYHKSGLFINASLSYLTAENQNRVDLYTAAAGYEYFGKKSMIGFSIDEYFFSDESYSVQAEMNTYISAYGGYDLKTFMIMADASLGISNSTDFFLGMELSRMFYTMKNRLIITPSFYVNFGTQQYYNEYYSQRSMTTGEGKGGKGNGSGMGSGGGGSTSTMTTMIGISESEKFQPLDYELALQTTYRIKQLRLTASATFLFPTNPSTVVTDQATYQEELENGFLWSVGARYLLK